MKPSKQSSVGRWVAATSITLAALLTSASGCGSKTGENSTTNRPAKVTASAGDPQQPNAEPGGPTEISATDECATQLHNICGPLLTYYAIHRRLPSQLDELRTMPGADAPLSFTCPASGKPYVYRPEGVTVVVTVPQKRNENRPDFRGHVILHDPEPLHSGHHWAIAIDEPKANQPFLAKVVAVHPQRLKESMREER